MKHKNRILKISVKAALLFTEKRAMGNISKFITIMDRISARKINNTSLADSFTLLRSPVLSYRLFIFV
ncbi:MAG: hypothetical protein JW864_05480 [Spirochaetes bacterium]|nr:hypothetical protein [Spirochaetota bacterium]